MKKIVSLIKSCFAKNTSSSRMPEKFNHSLSNIDDPYFTDLALHGPCKLTASSEREFSDLVLEARTHILNPEEGYHRGSLVGVCNIQGDVANVEYFRILSVKRKSNSMSKANRFLRVNAFEKGRLHAYFDTRGFVVSTVPAEKYELKCPFSIRNVADLTIWRSKALAKSRADFKAYDKKIRLAYLALSQAKLDLSRKISEDSMASYESASSEIHVLSGYNPALNKWYKRILDLYENSLMPSELASELQ